MEILSDHESGADAELVLEIWKCRLVFVDVYIAYRRFIEQDRDTRVMLRERFEKFVEFCLSFRRKKSGGAGDIGVRENDSQLCLVGFFEQPVGQPF